MDLAQPHPPLPPQQMWTIFFYCPNFCIYHERGKTGMVDLVRVKN